MTDANSTIIRSKSKKQKDTEIWIVKYGFKPDSRLDWETVEAILEWQWFKLWSTGTYASRTEFTRLKLEHRISKEEN